jgi:integrase
MCSGDEAAEIRRGPRSIITLRREQIHDATQEVHALGTKAHQRNRVVRIDSWAGPYIQEMVRDKLPTAYLFPEAWRRDRSIVSKLHRRTVAELQIEPQLTLHHARHAWAVSHLRAGMPTALVQQQLGHAGPMLTLTRYGAFIPQRDDRDHWGRVVEEYQARGAVDGAIAVNG